MSEFDRFMASTKGTGGDPDFRQAATNVHDTLFLAWKSAKSIFGTKASPEHALEICKQMMDEHERIRAEEDFSLAQDENEEE